MERRREKKRLRKLTTNLVNVARTVRNEVHDIEIVQQPVYLRNLPESFEGYTIAQISDIHHGSFVKASHISAAVETINQMEVDLVVLTGDYVTHSCTYIEPCAELLGGLRAWDGVFAVLGNHDFWTDADQTARALKQEEIGVLRNAHTQLRRDGESVTLVGVDDMTVERDDLAAALRGVSPSGTKILLSHNPSLIRQASLAGIDLVMAGHTHGGQIRLSTRNRRSQRIGRFWRGHGRVGETQVYVNRGLGTVIVPVRYQCAPEITVLELRRCSPDRALWGAQAPEDDEATADLC